LNYVGTFFWATLPLTNAICQARVVFPIIGETLILGAMFSKCWEINKIFQRVEKGDISPFKEIPWWKFCRIFFVIIFLQMILLNVLMVTDAPQAATYLNDVINIVGKHSCAVQNNSLWLALEAIFFVLLMGWGAFLAYQTRHVWTRYKYPNESRGILLSIYNLAFSAIILTPPLAILNANDDTLFVLICFAITYPTTFALTSVYVPKLASFLGSSFKRSKHSKGASSGPKQDGSRTTARGHHSHEERHESLQSVLRAGNDESRLKHEKRSPAKEEDVSIKNKSSQENSPALETRALIPLTPSGDWRVLVNPLAANEDTVVESVFDSPEAAAKSSLIG